MGLDMYLEKHTYCGFKWKADKPDWESPIEIKDDFGGIRPERIRTVIEEVGYWRKANAIHAWFVANVQDGVDDCGEHWVSYENLQELLDTVRLLLKSLKLSPGKIQVGQRGTATGWEPILEDGEIIENPEVAQEFLPSVSGFFFGSTGYNSMYMDDLRNTEKVLVEALKDPDADYYYRASW